MARLARGASLAASLAALACGPKLAVPEAPRPETEALRDSLAGAAAERTLDTVRRLLVVSTRLRVAGAPLCGDEVAWSLDADVSRAAEDTADEPFNRALGLDETLRFLVVREDGAAARAGIRRGDALVAVGDEQVDQSDELDTILRRRPTPLVVAIERNGERRTVPIEASLACSVELGWRIAPNLYMGPVMIGENFGEYVTSGFVDFTASDDELAALIAHGLAHRILGQRSIRRQLDHEVEADRFGLFLMARAGYDPSAAPALWERVAVEKPWLIAHEKVQGAREAPHGRIGLRLPAMRRVLAEIREAQARGLDLRP